MNKSLVQVLQELEREENKTLVENLDKEGGHNQLRVVNPKIEWIDCAITGYINKYDTNYADNGIITCPLHGLQFSNSTKKLLNDPSPQTSPVMPGRR
jgi:hypothetical protein